QPGSIGGDENIGVGTVGDIDLGDGFTSATINFSDGQEGLAFGVYWLPGLTPNEKIPTSGTFEIGGYFQSLTDGWAQYGMFAPPSNVALEPAVFDVSFFNAITVTAVPEPATLTLSALGLAALMRRRRK
ncbi:MAG: PEP-CTERM sorting domain-containing protein, partial [Akkermansiaceae bacterium]|nr:PEP-CTERM sorting domain-containing protein [Akkermansiaceae bacterium]